MTRELKPGYVRRTERTVGRMTVTGSISAEIWHAAEAERVRRGLLWSEVIREAMAAWTEGANRGE